MSGPWMAAGTSSLFTSFGVAVTYPRHPRGRIRSPLRGTGTPWPQLMPKKPTRMEAMVLVGRLGVRGEGDGDGAGDGDGRFALGEGDGDGEGAGVGVADGRGD